MDSLVHRSCPLCGRDARDDEALALSRGPWKLKECRSCSCVYLENAVPSDAMLDTYSWSGSRAEERGYRAQREPVFSFVSQKVKALRLKYFWRDKAPALVDRFVGSGRVLDVGSGDGKVLRRLNPKIQPYGVEIDREAALALREFARERGGDVYHNDALSGLREVPDKFFDGIVMRSFLEHVNQPGEMLEQTRRTLRQGGRVIIKVPNYGSLNRVVRGRRWCGFRFPDHVTYFTPRTLVALVRKAGLDVTCFDLRFRLPTSDNMWLIAKRPRADVERSRDDVV